MSLTGQIPHWRGSYQEFKSIVAGIFGTTVLLLHSFFLLLSNILLYKYTVICLFTFLFDGFLGCFWFELLRLWLLWVLLQVFLWIYAFISLCNYLEWNCWLWGKYMFNFIRNDRVLHISYIVSTWTGNDLDF